MPPLEQTPHEGRPLLGGQTKYTSYGGIPENGNKSSTSSIKSIDATLDPEINGEPSDEVIDKPLINPLRIILPLGAGIFLTGLDMSVINTNYAVIATDFERLELASWISTAYLLTLSSFQPLYGKLADVFGRKEAVLASYFLFGIGNLLCGISQSMEQLIAARVVQATGGAGIGVLVTVLLSDIVPLRERGPWQGYINLINVVGSSTGAPIGKLSISPASKIPAKFMIKVVC